MEHNGPEGIVKLHVDSDVAVFEKVHAVETRSYTVAQSVLESLRLVCTAHIRRYTVCAARATGAGALNSSSCPRRRTGRPYSQRARAVCLFQLYMYDVAGLCVCSTPNDCTVRLDKRLAHCAVIIDGCSSPHAVERQSGHPFRSISLAAVDCVGVWFHTITVAPACRIACDVTCPALSNSRR